MPIPLSCYILTRNSERRLHEVLTALDGVVDDLVIVDSGSVDATPVIAERFGARFVQRPFDDFLGQRMFALGQCRHDWVLAIDSDEVVSPALAAELISWKGSFDESSPDAPDAFLFRRDWYVLGKKVRCFYPSSCPDYLVRMFRKTPSIHYLPEKSVHESLRGFRRVGSFQAPINHYTCDSMEQLYGKLPLYTKLAAQDLRSNGRPSWFRVAVMPHALWFRWYVVKGGWRDGLLGLVLARYAYDTVNQKYVKARYDAPS